MRGHAAHEFGGDQDHHDKAKQRFHEEKRDED
jgi:hypothetical protein